MKSIEISNLQWDTDFFGIKCGKTVISDDEISFDLFNEQIKFFDFVTIQNVGNKVAVNKLLADNTNAFLADINIQFEKKLNKIDSEETNNNYVIVPANETSDEEISQMIVEEDDFKFSKFVCDDNLKKRKGYLVYKEWLNNARKATNKYFILKFDENEKISAYILFNITNDVGTIELVKVNREHQGNHIGSSMIKQIENYLCINGVDIVHVGTQLNNIPAMNLYHNLGFKEISRTSVFHLWKID